MNTFSDSPWFLSACAHLVLVAGIAALMRSNLSDSTEILPIDVYDRPVQAASPIQSQPLAQTKPRAQPRQIFGLSRKALTTDDVSGADVKSGNTTAKAPDPEKLRESDADSVPIPADEYLVTRMPELISDFRVAYPPEAKKQGIQGAVVFDLLIDAAGAVRQATLVSGPGHGLDEAAASAITRLKFKPALIEAKPVAVRIRYAYRFVLEK